MAPSLKIFVVENHDDIRFYLSKYLEQQGHEVESASDMHSALDLLEKGAPDVLISDIGLPDGNGWELLEALDPKPFAIAMSGFGSSDDFQRSEKAGYKHHITKPFLPEDLDILLSQAIEERTARGEKKSK
jgi:two-component system CheB/CheR fusion protein